MRSKRFKTYVINLREEPVKQRLFVAGHRPHHRTILGHGRLEPSSSNSQLLRAGVTQQLPGLTGQFDVERLL